jgi:hypothetical protein
VYGYMVTYEVKSLKETKRNKDMSFFVVFRLEFIWMTITSTMKLQGPRSDNSLLGALLKRLPLKYFYS